MKKNLVIIEASGKVQTLKKILGPAYEVKATGGHVYDLPKKGMHITLENEQFIPDYQIVEGKKKLLIELEKAARQAERVFLATDRDREGEAIAWHVARHLQLPLDAPIRLRYNAIEKNEIQKALQNPEPIATPLVNAQQARRLLDRLMGYELSPLLWRHLGRGKQALSAGRVQSVALRLIVEKEEALQAFTPVLQWNGKGTFTPENTKETFTAKLLSPISDPPALLERLRATSFYVHQKTTEPKKRHPSAPFNTFTLVEEANRRLGLPSDTLMAIAQALYMKGLITYIRTDATFIVESAQRTILDFLTQTYGKDYVQPRQYRTQVANAQEAHEAIRPIDITLEEAGDTPMEKAVYKLIRQRTLASQMTPAQFEQTKIRIHSTDPDTLIFEATGNRLIFDGYLKVYREEAEETVQLPDLQEKQPLRLQEILLHQSWQWGPARYTESTLVRELREKGLGRPSTISRITQVLLEKGYIYIPKTPTPLQKYQRTQETWHRDFTTGQLSHKSEPATPPFRKGEIVPTELGVQATHFLKKHFPSTIDYHFTAQMEGDLDAISRGEKDWQKVLHEFYQAFHPLVEKLGTTDSTSRRRLLGIAPDQKPIYVILGKNGPFLQKGEAQDPDRKIANLPHENFPCLLTIDEALAWLNLPHERYLGEWKGHPIRAKIGPHGPYLNWNQENRAIPKDKDFTSLSYEEAIEILSSARERLLGTEGNENVWVRYGRYGPYVQKGNLRVSIKPPYDPQTLSMEEALTLLAQKNAPLRSFPELSTALYRGPYGYYLRVGNKNIRLPKDIHPDTLTPEICSQIIHEHRTKSPKKR
ncbi:MAG: DNA topoisomerase [Bacteroidia bacterium]